MPIDYIIGDMYGASNTLLELLSSDKRYRKYGRFRCKCGNEFSARIDLVVSLNTRSCGCMRNIGVTKSPLYHTYNNIVARCYNPSNPCYDGYGARGIKISDEFINSIKAFIDHVESLPDYDKRIELKLELDRVDNDGNYERGNLRWATRKQQVANRRPSEKWKRKGDRKFKTNKSFYIIEE